MFIIKYSVGLNAIYLHEMLLILFLGLLFGVNTSEADLESKNVREGTKCRVVSPDNIKFDLSWAFAPKRYYFPLASKYNFYQQVEALLGRSAKNESELGALCRTVEVNQNGFALERGYDNSMTQSCGPLERSGQFNCTTTFASAATNATIFDRYIFNVLGTDNKSWLLLSRCTNDVHESWQLLTTNPNIEKTSTSVEEVRAMITRFGFDPTKLLNVGCTKCGITDPNQPYY